MLHKPITVERFDARTPHPLVHEAQFEDGVPGFWVQPEKGPGRRIYPGDIILTEYQSAKRPYGGRVWLHSEWVQGLGEPLVGLASRAMELAHNIKKA
jgi:hypothetical protein